MHAAEVLDSSGSNPTFRDIALPFAHMGIPVIPLVPGQKFPPSGMEGWQEKATTSPKQIEAWDAENPAYNVGLVAKPDGFCFLEFDIKRGMKQAAEEAGQPAPETRTHRSGKGFGHYVFRHTERSRRLGNRSANLPGGGEWFSFRANNKYIVGAGSTHPNGNKYSVHRDGEPIAIPDWLCDWIDKHSTPEKPKAAKGERPVSEDFDFDAFLEHYGIDVHGNGPWYVTPDCPYAGRGHEQSKQTGFFYDGSTLGFHCFAAGCGDPSVGDVIRRLNESHEPYRGAIWDEEPIEDTLGGFGIDMDEAAEATEPKPRGPAKENCYRRGCGCGLEHAELVPTQTENDCALDLPLEEVHPEAKPACGLMPDDSEFAMPPDCMYGWVGKQALRTQMPLSLSYPAMLAVASAAVPHHKNVRSNLYAAMVGSVSAGKTVTKNRVLKTVKFPENTVCPYTVSSDRGLIKLVGDRDGGACLVVLNEMLSTMKKARMDGSALAPTLCDLWDNDIAGVVDKRGVDECNGRLSIVGNLACEDPQEFSRVFGTETGKGLADRFIIGVAPDRQHREKPVEIEGEFRFPKACEVPGWCFERVNAWRDEDPRRQRNRLGEIALRVALVTASMNHESVITEECMEAALRFAEWQLLIRQSYKPGVAETKEAECSEAILMELNRRGVGERVHWAKMVNDKSWYRRFGSNLVNRVRQSLEKEGVIKVEKDEDLKKPTGYVALRGRIR